MAVKSNLNAGDAFLHCCGGKLVARQQRSQGLQIGARQLHRARRRFSDHQRRRIRLPARPLGLRQITLLNILAGFEPASVGTVMFRRRPIIRAGRERVMFFQDAGSALLPWLSVEENVRFALRVRKIPKADWPAIIDKYLRMVGSRCASHQISGRTVGRHAAAPADRPRAGGRAEGAAHGRAVRRARRADAPAHACRIARYLAAHRQDHRVRHP